MPEIFATIRDTPSVMLPAIEDLRKDQEIGACYAGLPANSTGKLNEAQAHEVEFLDTPAFNQDRADIDEDPYPTTTAPNPNI
jgi:hypothetical protein